MRITDETQKELDEIEKVEFNIFNLRKTTNENELVTSITYMLHKESIFQKLEIDVDTFMRFITKIQSGYRDIAYHNKTHASDLSQTAYFCCKTAEAEEILKLDTIDMASILIGGAIHDHEHPGVNNVYLVDTSDELAVRYNDQSVLENHHVASSFKLLKNKELDIFQEFDKDDFKTIRKKMIGLVLATDMSKHFSEMGKYKPRISAPDFDPTTG